MPHRPIATALASICALTLSGSLSAQDLPRAEQQFAARDYTGIIDNLLPAEETGHLDDSQALMWLGIACEQAKVPPRNRAHPCNRRRAEIMVKAAERGHPEAMYLASVGLMGTGAGRIGISIPFLDDGKRVDALMWAALAAHFAQFIADDDLQRRASARAADLARGLHQELRGQESLAQRAMRQADAKKAALQDVVAEQSARQAHARAVAALGSSGKLPWLDAAAQRREHRYIAGPDSVEVEELDFMEEGSESDAGAPPHLDPGSIVRNGNQIQYVFAGMGDATLVQARCGDGTPTLIWDADFAPESPEYSTIWLFQPSWRQPIPRVRGELDYYRTITRKACSLAAH